MSSLKIAVFAKVVALVEKENEMNGEKQIKASERERDCKRQRGLIALC